MNSVQGFLGGLLLVGVRTPVLPSVAGDLSSSASPGLAASPAPAEVDGSGGGVELDFGATSGVLASSFFSSPPAPSFSAFSLSALSARSLSFRSFFSFFFNLSFSAFSGLGVPLGLLPVVGLSLGVPVPVPGGGVDAVDLLALWLIRWGGRGLSGTGVDPFVGGWLEFALVLVLGRADVEELGVGATVAVRRYA